MSKSWREKISTELKFKKTRKPDPQVSDWTDELTLLNQEIENEEDEDNE